MKLENEKFVDGGLLVQGANHADMKHETLRLLLSANQLQKLSDFGIWKVYVGESNAILVCKDQVWGPGQPNRDLLFSRV